MTPICPPIRSSARPSSRTSSGERGLRCTTPSPAPTSRLTRRYPAGGGGRPLHTFPDDRGVEQGAPTSLRPMRIGFAGAGNMAGAMARGWAGAEGGPEAMLFCDIEAERAATLAEEVGGEVQDDLP